MVEQALVVLFVVGVAALLLLLAPRLIGYWFAHRSWKLSSADVDGKFHGLALFGNHGAYLAFIPNGEKGCVSFTKQETESGLLCLRLTIKSDRLSPSRAAAIEAKLDAQPEQVSWSLRTPSIAGAYEIELSGPLVSDRAAMEGVAAAVLAVLGFDSSQKYRIAFEGPSDEDKVAEFLKS